MKLHMTLAPCIDHHRNVLAFKNPELKQEDHAPPQRIRMNAYHVSGNPMEGAHKYMSMVKRFKEKQPESGFHLRGMLHPIAFTGNFNLVTVFQEDSVDKNLDEAMKFLTNPDNAEFTKEVFGSFKEVSSRLLKRITPEKIEQIKKAAHCK